MDLHIINASPSTRLSHQVSLPLKLLRDMIKWKNWCFFQNPLLQVAHTLADIQVTDCSPPCMVIIDAFSRVGFVALQPFPCCRWWMSTKLRWSDTVTNQDSITALCCVTPFEQRTLAPQICHPPFFGLNRTLPYLFLLMYYKWGNAAAKWLHVCKISQSFHHH